MAVTIPEVVLPTVTIPSITVPDEQGAQILAAYASLFGNEENAEPSLAFQKWLLHAVREMLFDETARAIDAANSEAKANALAQLDRILPSAEALVKPPVPAEPPIDPTTTEPVSPSTEPLSPTSTEQI